MTLLFYELLGCGIATYEAAWGGDACAHVGDWYFYRARRAAGPLVWPRGRLFTDAGVS
jgi:hypothetical protein